MICVLLGACLPLILGCIGVGGIDQRPKYSMAVFVEHPPNEGVDVVQMQIHRSNQRSTYVASRPVLLLSPGMMTGVGLEESGLGVLTMEVRFSSRGTAEMQRITAKYQEQRLFFVVAQPHPDDKKKLVSRCLGVVFVNQTIAPGAVKFTPDANREEAIEIANGLQKALK